MAGHAWACVCARLDGRDLASLALASRHLHDIAMDDANWRELCLRSLGLDRRCSVQVSAPWRQIYVASSGMPHRIGCMDEDGNNSSLNWTRITHWMRIGAFIMVSGQVLATDCLKNEVKFVTENNNGENKPVRDNFKPLSYWLFDDAKPGIWIAGTMQTLDVRHAELFLQHEYQSGEWRHTLESEHKVPFQCVQAASGVFDAMYLNTEETRSVRHSFDWS
eukprot:SM000001S04639  [mRNA]  locus=s1:1443368:1444530:+ [translate_table: standard]